jgi:hypothetical protein
MDLVSYLGLFYKGCVNKIQMEIDDEWIF